MSFQLLTQTQHVTPAKAGVQNILKRLDSSFHRNDGLRVEHPSVSAYDSFRPRHGHEALARETWFKIVLDRETGGEVLSEPEKMGFLGNMIMAPRLSGFLDGGR